MGACLKYSLSLSLCPGVLFRLAFFWIKFWIWFDQLAWLSKAGYCGGVSHSLTERNTLCAKHAFWDSVSLSLSLKLMPFLRGVLEFCLYLYFSFHLFLNDEQTKQKRLEHFLIAPRIGNCYILKWASKKKKRESSWSISLCLCSWQHSWRNETQEWTTWKTKA